MRSGFCFHFTAGVSLTLEMAFNVLIKHTVTIESREILTNLSQTCTIAIPGSFPQAQGVSIHILSKSNPLNFFCFLKCIFFL